MSNLIISGDIPSSTVTHECLSMSLRVILSPASSTNILFNRSRKSSLIDTFRHAHSDQNDSLGKAAPLRLPLTPRALNSCSLQQQETMYNCAENQIFEFKLSFETSITARAYPLQITKLIFLNLTQNT